METRRAPKTSTRGAVLKVEAYPLPRLMRMMQEAFLFGSGAVDVDFKYLDPTSPPRTARQWYARAAVSFLAQFGRSEPSWRRNLSVALDGVIRDSGTAAGLIPAIGSVLTTRPELNSAEALARDNLLATLGVGPPDINVTDEDLLNFFLNGLNSLGEVGPADFGIGFLGEDLTPGFDAIFGDSAGWDVYDSSPLFDFLSNLYGSRSDTGLDISCASVEGARANFVGSALLMYAAVIGGILTGGVGGIAMAGLGFVGGALVSYGTYDSYLEEYDQAKTSDQTDSKGKDGQPASKDDSSEAEKTEDKKKEDEKKDEKKDDQKQGEEKKDDDDKNDDDDKDDDDALVSVPAEGGQGGSSEFRLKTGPTHGNEEVVFVKTLIRTALREMRQRSKYGESGGDDVDPTSHRADFTLRLLKQIERAIKKKRPIKPKSEIDDPLLEYQKLKEHVQEWAYVVVAEKTLRDLLGIPPRGCFHPKDGTWIVGAVQTSVDKP